jgi:hypothetical protein
MGVIRPTVHSRAISCKAWQYQSLFFLFVATGRDLYPYHLQLAYARQTYVKVASQRSQI